MMFGDVVHVFTGGTRKVVVTSSMSSWGVRTRAVARVGVAESGHPDREARGRWIASCAVSYGFPEFRESAFCARGCEWGRETTLRLTANAVLQGSAVRGRLR